MHGQTLNANKTEAKMATGGDDGDDGDDDDDGGDGFLIS